RSASAVALSNLNLILKCLTHLTAQVISFPFTPKIVRLPQMLGADLYEVTQQPDKRRNLIVLFFLARPVDVFTKILDPDVAVMDIAECGLYPRRILRQGLERSPPTLLKELQRVAQTFRGDAHVVQRLDL